MAIGSIFGCGSLRLYRIMVDGRHRQWLTSTVKVFVWSFPSSVRFLVDPGEGQWPKRLSGASRSAKVRRKPEMEIEIGEYRLSQ
jgi:hypothetical protein